MDGPAPPQYEVYQDAGDMSTDSRMREPIVLVAGATSSDEEQLRGPGTGSAKRIPKETGQNGTMGWETMTAITISKHDMGNPPGKTRQTKLQRRATEPGLRLKDRVGRKLEIEATQAVVRTRPDSGVIKAGNGLTKTSQ